VIALAIIVCSGLGMTAEDAPPDACESGYVTARTCAAAEAWMRAGLRDGQTLIVQDCTPSAAPLPAAGRAPGRVMPGASLSNYPAVSPDAAGAFPKGEKR
jgi:hypothetical protein